MQFISSQSTHQKQENKTLLIFMLCWFVVNAVQAYFLGLEGDEAYYWQLSKHIDWSYFDHPPMVTLLIRIGESIGHGTFFTRLGTIIITTLSVGIIYKGLPNEVKNIKGYMLLTASTLLLNVYSFITTPDAPLLFFASLFLLTYKSFLQKNTLVNATFMALAITGMFYSKYHGLLLVIFVVLSNPKLLLNKYFWLTVVLTTVLFLPHIYWQYTHDWPSVRYHLNERLAKHYKFSFTTDYLLGQLLVFGPLISLLFYATCYKLKIKGKLLRAHLFIFFGTLVFFLISSFKNTVEAHWTLIATASYITLFMWLIVNGTEKYQRIFKKLAIANITIIIIARFLFFVPNSPFLLIRNYYPFFFGKEWATELYEKAGKKPVIFENSYVLPSLYMYYNDGARAFDYNTKSYRKTNYNLQDDCTFAGKPVWYFKVSDIEDSTLPHIKTKYAQGSLIAINDFTCVNDLKITATKISQELKANSYYKIEVTVENKSDRVINIYNTLKVDYAFFVAKYDYINAVEDYPLAGNTFLAKEKKTITINLKTPEKPGRYKILFSLKNSIFTGNFASPFYEVRIK